MTRLYTAAVDRSRIAVPYRQVRAVWDAQSITVYQAYGPAIAEPAIAAGRFVAPFSRSRMTWVKPSFLWMMYRSGWATKPGQERVLAMSRSGFEEALGLSCLSHMDPAVHNDREQWVALKARSPVRIQWDPERDTSLNPLPYRSLQVGIGPGAVDDYVDHWVLALRDRRGRPPARPAQGDRSGSSSGAPVPAARRAGGTDRRHPRTTSRGAVTPGAGDPSLTRAGLRPRGRT